MIAKAFYDALRPHLKLTNENVAGMDFILAAALKRRVPLHRLAYILATVWWETAHTMQPIAEYGKGKGRKYGVPHPKTGKVYYGRGYVQLTWYENYLKASTILGHDFVNNPDAVMIPEYAVQILFEGMDQGWFTGKDLDDFIDDIDEDDKEDLREFSNSRRIINGVDHQVEIGQIAIVFEHALQQAAYGVIVTPPAPETSPEPLPETAPIPSKRPDPEFKWWSLIWAFIQLLRR